MRKTNYIYGQLADQLRATILQMNLGETIQLPIDNANRLVNRFHVLRSKGKISETFKIKTRTIGEMMTIQRI